MRIYEPTIEAVASPENLLRAWRHVRGNIPRYRRERSSGLDGVSIDDFERNLPVELDALRYGMLNGLYQAQPMQRIFLPKPSGGQREIGILTVSDRVAQRAVQQVIEPSFDKKFLTCSHGFRPGLSTSSAVRDVKLYIEKGEQWMVDGDIENCFQSLEHRRLMKAMQVEIHDCKILNLLDVWMQENIDHAGPPEAGDWLDDVLTKVSSKALEGMSWASDAVYDEPENYIPVETNEGSYPTEDMYSYNQSIQSGKLLRKRAVKRIATGGLMMGASWIRPIAESAIGSIGTALTTPIGRKAFKQSALAIGGVAGLVAATGVAAYFVYRRSCSPAFGVLQGSPLSPLMANIYLNEFDHKMLAENHHLIRYADDWLLTCNNQHKAERGFSTAVQILEDMKLKLNLHKTHIVCPDESFKWLGIQVR